MKKHLLQIRTITLLASLVFLSSYYGQVKISTPTDNVGEQKTITNRYSKLVKTLGLSEYDNVHCSLIDKTGNLWFGTTGDGVYRYDGNLFTQITVKDGLSNNNISSILEDKNGNIWFGSANGVSRFDGQKFLSIPLTDKKNKNSISGNSVNNNPLATNDVLCIMQSKSGKLWFGTSDGVYCYDGKSFSLFLDNDSIINKENLHLKKVESIMEDRSGNIWFGSYVNEGVCLYDGKSLTRPFSSILLNKFSNKRIMCIKEDKNGIIWFGAGAGTFYYDGKNLTNITEKAAIYWTNSIFEDRNGNLWFATEDGSGQMDEQGGVWRYDGKSYTKFTTKEGLIHNGVFCTVEDQDGNLWFGTRNMGLCRYDGKVFTKFSE